MSIRRLFIGVLCLAILCLSVTVFAGEKEYKVFNAETGEQITGELEKDTISNFLAYNPGSDGDLLHFYVFPKDKETYINQNNKLLYGYTGKGGKSEYMPATYLDMVKSLIKEKFFEYRKEFFPETKSESEYKYEMLVKNFNIEAYAIDDSKKSSNKPSKGSWIRNRLPF